MRAILIDVKAQTITEVEKTEGIQSIYDHIKCTIFEVVDFSQEGNISCFVDEEGLMKEGYTDEDGEKHNLHAFRIGDWPHTIMGSGLIIGFDQETGEDGDCPLSIKEVYALVTFIEYDNQAQKPVPGYAVSPLTKMN